MIIFPSIHEYLILILDIHKEYAYISLWLCFRSKFVKKKRVKKKIFLEKIKRKKYSSGICE